MSSAQILDNKDPDEPSVFEPAALLREARRQKGLSLTDVPPLCILDPEGDYRCLDALPGVIVHSLDREDASLSGLEQRLSTAHRCACSACGPTHWEHAGKSNNRA